MRSQADSQSGFDRATIRSAGLRTAIEMLRDLGIDPKPVVESIGLSLDLFRDPDGEAPLAATLKLLTACARVSGLPHFSLLAGAHNGLATLGVFGHLALTAPDVRTAIDDIIGFLSVFDRVASARLAVEHDTAVLNYLFDFPSATGAADFCDGATAAISRMLRGICGENWRPLRVRLPRRRPANVTPYLETFGCEVTFGADFASIEFPARLLTRTPSGANATLRAFLEELVRQAEQKSGAEIERVRRIIRRQLVGGRPAVDEAAAALGIHRRTLARRLSAEGLTFKGLVGDLRFEIANDLLAKSDAPIARIAEMLGYSDQTVFSRAFSSRFGHPPSDMRKARP
jgi:AraC-like DNA-binding protein